jgi:hypothetical protein
MGTILFAVVSILVFRFRSRAALELKLVALQHQLAVLRRQRPGRPQFSSLDRLLWVLFYRIWPQVIDAMVLVRPATVVAWHRKGFRFYWRWRSRRPGRPRINPEIRDLIRRMSKANPLWGAPLSGQMIEAFPWDTAPRYLLRDRDKSYGPAFRHRVRAMGITEVVTAPRSPWQNPYAERLIGSIRRECLDHVIILNERHLRCVLSSYFQYHHDTRTHLSLGKDCPRPRRIQLPSTGNIIAFPEVGGLHHRYERRAA